MSAFWSVTYSFIFHKIHILKKLSPFNGLLFKISLKWIKLLHMVVITHNIWGLYFPLDWLDELVFSCVKHGSSKNLLSNIRKYIQEKKSRGYVNSGVRITGYFHFLCYIYTYKVLTFLMWACVIFANRKTIQINMF